MPKAEYPPGFRLILTGASARELNDKDKLNQKLARWTEVCKKPMTHNIEDDGTVVIYPKNEKTT